MNSEAKRFRKQKLKFMRFKASFASMYALLPFYGRVHRYYDKIELTYLDEAERNGCDERP